MTFLTKKQAAKKQAAYFAEGISVIAYALETLLDHDMNGGNVNELRKAKERINEWKQKGTANMRT